MFLILGIAVVLIMQGSLVQVAEVRHQTETELHREEPQGQGMHEEIRLQAKMRLEAEADTEGQEEANLQSETNLQAEAMVQTKTMEPTILGTKLPFIEDVFTETLPESLLSLAVVNNVSLHGTVTLIISVALALAHKVHSNLFVLLCLKKTLYFPQEQINYEEKQKPPPKDMSPPLPGNETETPATVDISTPLQEQLEKTEFMHGEAERENPTRHFSVSGYI